MAYKIESVSTQVDDWSSAYGAMKTYYIKFEGSTEVVKINQKDSTPAPTVGQELQGSIVEDKFGKKFKKETNFQSNSSGGKTEDPAKQDSIMRMNALTNAVNFYAVDESGEIEDIFARMLGILKDEKPADSGYQAAKETAEALKPAAKIAEDSKKEEEPIIEDSEVDLDSIPF